MHVGHQHSPAALGIAPAHGSREEAEAQQFDVAEFPGWGDIFFDAGRGVVDVCVAGGSDSCSVSGCGAGDAELRAGLSDEFDVAAEYDGCESDAADRGVACDVWNTG